MKLLSVSVFTFLVIGGIFYPSRSEAYSVLTHEAIVDASWEKSIKPLLNQKYPGSTEAQFKEAHAYAYGGAVFADMGYYPFGSILFTDLLHYVRSGDYINALLEESQNIDDYAFALGALSHYISDTYGHPLGINVAVPITYPKDKKKYGDTVTYYDDPTTHLRMEFSFDVLQMARGNYASFNYHDFIGFQVSKQLMERAFIKTYGIELNSIFANLPLAIGTFRWSVKNLIPEAVKYAWIVKKPEIRKAHPGATAKSFSYKMKRANYYEEFGKARQKPPIGSWILSTFIRILPKVGPLTGLGFKEPGTESEKLFIQSFDTVLRVYASYLKKLSTGKINLANKDFDTGKPTAIREYSLADENYNLLLLKLQDDKFDDLNPAIKQNILAFYNHSDSTVVTKKPKERKEVIAAFNALKNTP